MPEITDILAMFGEVDRIAGEHADNPLVQETVHRMLPGTAGYEQGWYSQVERFLQAASGRQSSPLPSYTDAVRSLGAERTPQDWPIPQQAKARYAATVLTQLYDATHGQRPVPSTEPDSEERDPLFDLSQVLGVGREGEDHGPEFIELIRQQRPSHSTWLQFAAGLAPDLISEDEARIHPPARGKIRAYNEEFCTQLDTPYEDPELDISAVGKVIDPLNWPACCKYWKSVKIVATPANPAGWVRLVEVLEAKSDLASVTLTTPLIYRNDAVGGGFVVNYDLDTDMSGLSPNDHDDFVYADSGYVWATPIDRTRSPTGVQVHTRKIVRIQGLGVAALAMYAYSMGWSTAGEDMILGCARRVSKKAPAFKVTPPAKATTPNLAPKVPPVPKLGAQERKDFIDKVVKATTKAIDDRSAKSSDLIERWLDGDLLPTDVTAAASDAAKDLASVHTSLHTAVTQAIPAPQPMPTTPTQANKKALAKKVPQKKPVVKKAPLKKAPPKKAAPPKPPKKGKGQ